MIRSIPALLAATALAACATTADQTVEDTGTGTMAAADVEAAQTDAGPELGTFGFDTAGMDQGVRPGQDFYDYANGTWAATTEIPADRSNYGMFARLEDLSQARTREILDEAKGDPASKIGRAYSSFLDENAVERAGLAPLKPWLDKISAIASMEDYARVAGELERFGVTPFLGNYVTQDQKVPTQYALYLTQSGLGLPDRDYYLDDENAELVATRAKYKDYMTELFTLAGMDNARARADAVYAFEHDLAEAHWARADRRDADKTYNKMTLADLEAKTPGFDMSRYLAAYGANVDSVIVNEPSAIEASARIAARTDLGVLRDHLTERLLMTASPYLPQDYVDLTFDFTQRTLSGTPENQERWKRGVDFTTSILGDEVGKVYVERYFPPETKAKADELVKNVIAAMDRRLASLDWMAPETKATARAKLAAFTPKIGYPDKWEDFSGLEIRADDLMGNVIRARDFLTQRDLDKLGGPIDRGEWFMTPMTINAYANPTMNEIVFPAAILQPPFFDPDADPAINYGSIGAVIGHEISHHFDDQGRKYDKTGALTDWWTPADVERFDALAQKLVDQYDLYAPLPGMNVQGRLTLGENIADLAGLTVAHDAYLASLGGKPAPVIDGYTADQRFYLGWAQVWRRNYREENLRQRLLTDPHSPSRERTWVVRNLDPWYAAYDPAESDAMYLSPAARVKIW